MVSNALDMAEVFSGDQETPMTRGEAAQVLYQTARELESRKMDTVI